MDKMRLDIRPTPELIAALDRWRRDQDGLPARSAAARMLLEKALAAEGMAAPVKVVARRKGSK